MQKKHTEQADKGDAGIVQILAVKIRHKTDRFPRNSIQGLGCQVLQSFMWSKTPLEKANEVLWTMNSDFRV